MPGGLMMIRTADPFQFDDFQIFAVALEDGEVMCAIEVDHMVERRGYEEIETSALAWPIAHPGALRGFEEAGQALQAMKIGHIWSYAPMDTRDEPGISLRVSWGGVYGPESLIAALEVAAAKEDNRQKLAYNDADRRHLFVAITSAAEDKAYASLTSMLDEKWYGVDDLPIISLPAPITTVWAGTSQAGVYVTPPAPWKRFG